MTHRTLTITVLLLIIACSSIAQEQTPSTFGLPEGVIARFGKGHLTHVQYSPDGTQLAVGSSIGTWIYDTTTWQPVHLLTKNDVGVDHFTYHPMKNILVSYENDFTINLWRTDEGKLVRELASSNRIDGIVFNPSGDTIALAKTDRIIRFLDAKTGKQKQSIRKPQGDESDINSLAYNPNGFILAAGEQSGKIALWDTVTGELVQDLDADLSEVRAVAFNNDGSILATGSASDVGVRLWDTSTLEQIQTLKAPERVGGINHIAFSADGGLLAAACVGSPIQLWDVNTYQHIKTLTGAGHSRVQSISFSPDLRSLASSGYDGTVRIWNIFTGETTQTIAGFYGGFNCFAVNPDRKTIACQEKNRTIYLFDSTTGRIQKKVRRPSYRSVDDIAYSPDGKTIAGADFQDITLFDVDTGKEKNRLEGHLGAVRCVAFSSDGNTIASGSEDTTVRLWNANTGELKHTLKGHEKGVISVAFSPDGKTIASGSEDMTVHLWNTNTGEKKIVTRKHGIQISDLSFSPDSKTIASAAYSPNIYLWDVATGKRILFLRKNPSQIASVAFSPDGKFLAIGSTTKGIFIYDVRKKRVIQNYVVNNRWVERVAFAADGRTLVSLVNSAIYLWDVSTLQRQSP